MPSSKTTPNPTFGRPAEMAFAASAAVTGAIAWWTAGLQADVGDPRMTRIFLALFAFQDHQAAILMLAVLPLALLRSSPVEGT